MVDTVQIGRTPVPDGKHVLDVRMESRQGRRGKFGSWRIEMRSHRIVDQAHIDDRWPGVMLSFDHMSLYYIIAVNTQTICLLSTCGAVNGQLIPPRMHSS